MAANLPVLSNRDLNRAKNKKAADEAIPFVYETIIEWGCQKEEDETFLHYYKAWPEKIWNDNKEEWEKEVEKILEEKIKMNNWSDEQKEKERVICTKKLKANETKKLLVKVGWTKEEEPLIDQNNCEGMDVTLLHKLTSAVCDGIGLYDPNAPSSTKIEVLLMEVKKKRNKICHDPKGASVSGTILDELEVSVVNVFKAAGVLYASTVDKQTVQEKMDEFKAKLRKIKEEVMTDDQHRILQTAAKICEDGLAEMREAVMKQTTDYLPLSEDQVTRATVFHPLDLLIVTDQDVYINDTGTDIMKDGSANREIPCHKLLEHFKENNVLCVGPPGTGKTTLLKMLREDFVALGQKRFSGVKKFDLLLYMECRNNSTRTIKQLLEQQFPMTLQQVSKQEAVEALLGINLLICVDGLDELTSSSQKLLQELVSIFGHKSNATFICTSRPGPTRSFDSLSYLTVTLQPITDEKQQIDFLKRYQANIEGFRDSDLIKDFESLNETCKVFLRQPVNLTLFCALFRKSPKAVKKWKTELNVMNEFLRLSMVAMKERMNKMDLLNPECYAEKVTHEIFELSLCLLQKQQMTITVKTYTALCQGIFGERDVPYYSILSSFFIQNSDQLTFDFFHKSNLEFLAAKAIEQRFLANPEDGVFGAIKVILRDRRTWIHNIHEDTVSEDTVSEDTVDEDAVSKASDATDGGDVPLRRYDNVMRFVIMMMVEGGSSVKGELKSFLKEVCPALAKDGGAKFSFWVDLTLSCPGSDEVAEAAAQAANIATEKDGSFHSNVWRIETSREMRAVSHMLRFHQPARLDVRPPRSDDLPAELTLLLKAVGQWHDGQLDLYIGQSFFSFLAIDDLVKCLESERFPLRQFRGCLGPSRKARQVLAAAVQRAEGVRVLPDLDIALTQPRQHQLEGLGGTRHWLYVLAQLNPNEVPLRCSLPRGSVRPPELSVNCKLVKDEVLTKTVSLIEDLAPQDGQYHVLSLHQWPGSDPQLEELLQQLSDSGVSTADIGSPRWEQHGASSDGRCNACLSVHEEG